MENKTFQKTDSKIVERSKDATSPTEKAVLIVRDVGKVIKATREKANALTNAYAHVVQFLKSKGISATSKFSAHTATGFGVIYKVMFILDSPLGDRDAKLLMGKAPQIKTDITNDDRFVWIDVL